MPCPHMETDAPDRRDWRRVVLRTCTSCDCDVDPALAESLLDRAFRDDGFPAGGEVRYMQSLGPG